MLVSGILIYEDRLYRNCRTKINWFHVKLLFAIYRLPEHNQNIVSLYLLTLGAKRNTMGRPKISVIIPVYNPGIYFEDCIKSLVNQTLKEIEIIFILDCPTDGSEKVAEKYAAEDNRILLIYNEKNIHIGLSRNKGLAAATGEYIGFHDADDRSEPRMYELLYQKAKSGDYDIVRCNFNCIYPCKSDSFTEPYTYPEVTGDLIRKMQIYEKICGDTVSCVIWNHIFKADLVSLHHITFVDSSKITSEDSIFFFEVYKYADKIGIVPDYLYYHIFHQSNTGGSYKYRSVGNRLRYFELLYALLQERGLDKEISYSFLTHNLMKSLYTASRQALKRFPLRKGISEIRQIRDNALAMECIRYMYGKDRRKALLEMKPTIIVLFSILRLFPERK